jgi:hypothetical protein
MDPVTNVIAASAAGNGLKKQPKTRKMVKDMTPDERRIESDKRAGRREAVKSRQQAARLNKESLQEIEHYLAFKALANSEELASKADVCVVMLMKQEALNNTFGGAVFVSPFGHTVRYCLILYIWDELATCWPCREGNDICL